MEIKSYFKVSLKAQDWKPSIKEVSYQGADWETYTWLQFEWYASTKDIDRTNDVVLPWAFKKSIEMYMENPIIFLQHDADKPIGSVISASIDDNWLFIVWIVKSDKDNIFQDLRTGVIKTMSFGYRVNKYEQKEKEEKNKTTYYYEIQELELFEVSLVSVPMNPKAKIKSKEELLGKNLSDEEYAKYFQVNKNDEYSLFKSISDVMSKYTETLEDVEEDDIDIEEAQETIEELQTEAIDELKKKWIQLAEWMKTMSFDCEIKKLDVPELYKNKIPLWAIYFEWVVSDETVNRYWEKVLSSAFKWQMKKFIKNGVILNGHNSDEPIGLPLRVKINQKNQVEVGGYVFDEYTENRVSKWLYRWLSIWFIPTEWVWEDKTTGEQISHKEFLKLISKAETFEEFFEILDKYMFVITKLDWLEYSFVTTPANKGTTIKLDYIECKQEYKDKLSLWIDKKDIDTKEEKMQLDPVVEIEPTKKPKEEPKEEVEDKPKEEVEDKLEPQGETPIDTVDENEINDIETQDQPQTQEEEKPNEIEEWKEKEEVVEEVVDNPKIPENDDWEIVDTEDDETETSENEEEWIVYDVLEERVNDIEKSFNKSIAEIGEKFKNVEWLELLVKEVKETFDTSIKEFVKEQNEFRDEVEEVVAWCIDLVNVLATNFKNFCIDGWLAYTEHTETAKEKKEKELMKSPLAKTLEQIKG
jgi:HK97 family phage prohead protease